MQDMLAEYSAMAGGDEEEEAGLASDGSGIAGKGRRAVGALATRLQQLSRAVTTVPPPGSTAGEPAAPGGGIN